MDKSGITNVDDCAKMMKNVERKLHKMALPYLEGLYHNNPHTTKSTFSAHVFSLLCILASEFCAKSVSRISE